MCWTPTAGALALNSCRASTTSGVNEFEDVQMKPFPIKETVLLEDIGLDRHLHCKKPLG